MISLITEKHDALVAMCRRFNVVRLEVFGSAADGSFDPHTSDIDLLVEFHPNQPLGPWLAHYFDFKQALEGLFGKPVDLVMPSAMRNPHFIREVDRTRSAIFAA